MTYYERQYTTTDDGLVMFANADDHANESAVVAQVERAWEVKCHRFAPYSVLDRWCERDGLMAAVIETKTRTHATTTYPTVFLNLRKWFALREANRWLNLPAVFVVGFTDKAMWVNVNETCDCAVTIGGCAYPVKAESDVEPIVEVPISRMHVLGGAL